MEEDALRTALPHCPCATDPAHLRLALRAARVNRDRACRKAVSVHQASLRVTQPMQPTDVPSVVHHTITAVCILRGLTVPGDVVGHAAEIVPAVGETAAGETVGDLDLAAAERVEVGVALGDKECARRPTPEVMC